MRSLGLALAIFSLLATDTRSSHATTLGCAGEFRNRDRDIVLSMLIEEASRFDPNEIARPKRALGEDKPPVRFSIDLETFVPETIDFSNPRYRDRKVLQGLLYLGWVIQNRLEKPETPLPPEYYLLDIGSPEDLFLHKRPRFEDFVIGIRDEPETFSARYVAETRTLQISWSEDRGMTFLRLREILRLAKEYEKPIDRIEGYFSARLEELYRSGRVNGPRLQRIVDRALPGKWEVTLLEEGGIARIEIKKPAPSNE